MCRFNKVLLTIIYLILSGFIVNAQENLVPNPGFESYKKVYCRWMQSARQFSKSLDYWNVPTETHPDIFTTLADSNCWANPLKQSNGKEMPHSGNFMVGLSFTGHGGRPQNRLPWHEYIQVELTQPLVEGERYYAEMWVLFPGIATKEGNNLSMWFSDTAVHTGNRLFICANPQISAPEIVSTPGNEWQKINGVFKAQSAAKYLLIGNFYYEEQTKLEATKDGGTKGSYYLVDDVLVRKAGSDEALSKIPPQCHLKPKVKISQVETHVNDLLEIRYQKEQTITLNNLHFEVDKTELLPESEDELEKLYTILFNYPGMLVEINGHTDNTGSDEHNLALSKGRAQAVADWLHKKGIKSSRMTVNGYGSKRPVADNATDEGKAKNRRVVLVVKDI